MLSLLKNHLFLVVVLLLALLLRVWQLDRVPVSLFGDELDMGYHAYSLLKTGKDYTGHFLPLHLQSLADKKPPLFAYSQIPTIALFGISPLGVRIPAVFWGMVNILLLYLIVKITTKNHTLAVVAALIMAVNPWHIQFSRWGSEVTMMLSFFLAGLYSFLRGFKKGWWIVASACFFGLSLWTYHAAKVFLPLILTGLAVIWHQELRRLPKKVFFAAVLTLLITVAPIAVDTLFSGGAERFGSTSVFTDQVAVAEIELARVKDLNLRSSREDITDGSSFPERLIHNRLVFFITSIANNYLQSFSAEFLFIKGDPNLRHNLANFGEFYPIEALFLVLGLVFLFTKISDNKLKSLILIWLLLAPIPSVITSGGGSHAIRLFNMMPPLVILITLGVYYIGYPLNIKFRGIYIILIGLIFTVNVALFQHYYFNHYPYDSERWWQGGFQEAIQSVILENRNYDRVIISNADEPSLLFFLAWSQYPPNEFQEKYPLPKTYIDKMGSFSRLDNFYFGEMGVGSDLYSLGSKLPKGVLYLATFKEINLDLVKEPERVPSDIKLVKTITYPSGKPAFYLLTR